VSYVAVAGLIVTGGSAIYKGVKAGNAKKANEKLLANTKMPFYKIQDEYQQNRNIAANLAGGGLPDSTKNYLTTEAQRGFSAATSASNQLGGSPNDIGRLYEIYNRSIDKTAAQDAEIKINNIQNYMNVNKDLAGQKTMQWTLNELRPYERKVKQLTGNIAAEQQNVNNAVNEGASAVSSYAVGRANSNLMRDLFRNNAGTTVNGQVDTVPELQYNQPTNNVAQGNPTSFIAPNQTTWAQQTDINGNPLQNTPVMPQQQNQSQPATQIEGINDPNLNPFGEGNGFWDGTKWVRG
jgi:hypothetical protein